MAFIDINGSTVRYDLRGPENAPVVMLAHSIGTNAMAWREVAETLAPRFRMLSYDMRGHGMSDTVDGACTMAALAGDAVELLDALDIRQVHFVGVSLGGMIGQQLAATYPQRVASASLFDTAPRIGTRDAWLQRAADIRAQGLEALADGLVERWFTPQFKASAAWRGWRNHLARSSVPGYAAGCEAIAEADLSDLVSGIACPTLVAAGRDDIATTPDDARHLAGLIAGARLRIIDNCAHLPPIEQPQATAHMLQTFLDEVTDD